MKYTFEDEDRKIVVTLKDEPVHISDHVEALRCLLLCQTFHPKNVNEYIHHESGDL